MDSRRAGADASTRLAGSRFAHVEWVAETGSTNRDLLERAAAGAPEGLVAVTDHQTAGRGTRGRSWFDPPGGSLLVSVLLRPGLPPSRLHLLTMAFGVAAVEACHEVAGVDVGLKWPNDLLVADRKLAGILAESQATGPDIDAVVVGMGMNVNWPEAVPVELAEAAVALNQVAGHDVERIDLLVALLGHFDRIYRDLTDEAGRTALLLRYRQRSVTLGREVRITLPAGEVIGTATDVTDEGHLVIDVDGELATFSSGDVVHLRPR
jgi:BirA family transcriptional regulator, biotin operon repressor / biotin---[acetyl-CoA-carboxylase] ligase